MHPDLKDLLDYRNHKIITRYNMDYPTAAMQAEEALHELMKFIWLCHKHKADKLLYPDDKNLDFSCVIHAEMADIDKMWHTFLLFTRDYHEFCDTCLNGNFFHHDPLIGENTPVSEEDYALELTRYLTYIHDHLGSETLIKWFQ